jgi:hypothetical protein
MEWVLTSSIFDIWALRVKRDLVGRIGGKWIHIYIILEIEDF